MITPFEIVLSLLAFTLFVGATAFWIAMLIEVATKETDPNERLVWVIIVVFTHIIGALIYFFVRRPIRMNRPSE